MGDWTQHSGSCFNKRHGIRSRHMYVWMTIGVTCVQYFHTDAIYFILKLRIIEYDFCNFVLFFHYDSVYQWNGYSDRLDDIMKSIGQGSYCEKEILGWINWLNFDQTLSINVSIMLKYPPRFIDYILFRHHADTFLCKSQIWVHCIARKLLVFRFEFYTLHFVYIYKLYFKP